MSLRIQADATEVEASAPAAAIVTPNNTNAIGEDVGRVKGLEQELASAKHALQEETQTRNKRLPLLRLLLEQLQAQPVPPSPEMSAALSHEIHQNW